MSDPVPARMRDTPLVVLFLGFIPSVTVAARVMDALWMAVGVILVMMGTSIARRLLDAPRAQPRRGANDTEGQDLTARWLRALVISSLLTAAFEAALLAVAPAASSALGIYAPLVAVSLLVVGDGTNRSDVSLLRTGAAALRRGAQFAAALVAIALVREVLGAGTITLFPAGRFGGTIAITPLLDQPVRALSFAGGGLLCLGYLAGAARAVAARRGAAASGRRK